MNPFLRFLPWDTEFFGYPVFSVSKDEALAVSQISPAEFLREAEKAQAKLIYLNCAPSHASAIGFYNACGAVLYDTKMLFKKQLVSLLPSAHQNPHIKSFEYFQNDLTAQLEPMLFDAGKYSRFKLDRHFVKDEFRRLYKKWLENSLNKTIANEVFIAHNLDNIPLGFVTVLLKNDVAEIGLISVAETSRGQGTGTQLLARAQEYAILNGAKVIRVPTQEKNELACKFYQKNGYVEIEKTCVFHLWVGGKST